MRQLMAFLCEIPPDLVKVRYTATLIIGRYAFWLVERPHILLPLLNYVIQGFEIPDVCRYLLGLGRDGTGWDGMGRDGIGCNDVLAFCLCVGF